MREFTTNNTWGHGGLDLVPDEAAAVYSARWIDEGDYRTPSILGDRQGFAYDDSEQRDVLIRLLDKQDANGAVMRASIPHDDEHHQVLDGGAGFQLWARRAGGYFYVTAWII